ncbi:MAG: GNAT family N-acetyltransferase [Myxococcota bacterium]
MSAEPLPQGSAAAESPCRQIRIELRDAACFPHAFERYQKGLTKALRTEGRGPIEDPVMIPWEPEECLLVAALDERGYTIGGIQLQRHGSRRPLPCFETMRRAEVSIDELVGEDTFDGGHGELGGLWIGAAYRGYGLDSALTEAAMSLARDFCGRWLWGLCPEPMLVDYVAVGFQLRRDLAEDGRCWSEPMREHAWIIHADLDSAQARSAPRYGLRQRLARQRRDRYRLGGPRDALSVSFDLRWPQRSP